MNFPRLQIRQNKSKIKSEERLTYYFDFCAEKPTDLIVQISERVDVSCLVP